MVGDVVQAPLVLFPGLVGVSLEGGSLGFHGAFLRAPGALILFQLLVEARDFLVQSRYRVLVLLAAVL